MKTILICCLILTGAAFAQPSPPAPVTFPTSAEPPANAEEGEEASRSEITPLQPSATIQPQYRGAALDILLQEIGNRTGKVMLRDPQVPEIQVNLVSNAPMPVTEFLEAAESLLAMNNIALVPFRENFLKVVPAAGAERTGVPLVLDPDREQPEEDQVISQLLVMTYLDTSEVQPLITERLSQSATVQTVERANALLVTDTRANIARIRKILAVLDQPAEVREGVKIYQLVHAAAPEVKTKLEQLIEQSQERFANGGASRPNRVAPVTPRGVIRPGLPTNTDSGGGEEGSGAAPGLIRGQVQIVADERTNILMIISRPVNDAFFEEMVAALDRKVDPEIVVRIFNLQFADADEASTTLNELIGAATESDGGPNVDGTSERGDGGTRSGQSVRDFVQRREAPDPSSANGGTSPAGGIESLAENTRILADVRTNSLILMGRNRDLDVLEDVIRELDKMLAQVAVRAVVMEVILNDSISYGVDWLQRSLTVQNVDTVNGVPVVDPIYSFGGGQDLNSAASGFIDAADVGRDIALNPGGLSYFATFYDFNIDAALRLAQSSSNAKVVATPIIVTTDNTEASIRVGERRAIPTTTATTIGGSVQSSFDYENIGLDLAVKPRINPQGMVIMEVTQTAENVGGTTTIDGNEVPIITSRELEASVAIRSGGTLALGGLVREDTRDSETKVPLLGDLPFLGFLFRSTDKETVRTELIVLLSPEVLVTSEEAESLTRRLKDATELKDETWHDGWGLPYEKGEERPEPEMNPE